ncbi:MAG TPA: Uma2 family endonuclease [Chthonomonadaceae bacterium]|nr:Uma2 family endonuclease [Chthonomonadaceae bacterium]
MTTTLKSASRPQRASKPIRFTLEQKQGMERRGILDPNRRYELIEGEIYELSDNPPHGSVLTLLIAWLNTVFGAMYVRGQMSISTGQVNPKYNAPQPDAAVTRDTALAYFHRLPGPQDILLLVEVSDTTRAHDLGKKARLYAKAGIVEYWVLDINRRRLTVHRQPTPTGYTEILRVAEEESVSPLARPEHSLRVADLFPPRD